MDAGRAAAMAWVDLEYTLVDIGIFSLGFHHRAVEILDAGVDVDATDRINKD